MCGRHSIFYVCVTCCYLDITKRHGETAREKARGNNNGPSHVPSKREEEIKSGTSGCGSFVVGGKGGGVRRCHTMLVLMKCMRCSTMLVFTKFMRCSTMLVFTKFMRCSTTLVFTKFMRCFTTLVFTKPLNLSACHEFHKVFHYTCLHKVHEAFHYACFHKATTLVFMS